MWNQSRDRERHTEWATSPPRPPDSRDGASSGQAASRGFRVAHGALSHSASSDTGAEALEILNGYTEMGQGIYTATMQAVSEETGLPESS